MTGAGQGIGKAIAERIAADGATGVVTDINEGAVEDTALGNDSIGLRTDVTDHA